MQKESSSLRAEENSPQEKQQLIKKRDGNEEKTSINTETRIKGDACTAINTCADGRNSNLNDVNKVIRVYSKPLIEKVIHGDCLEKLRTIADNSIDLFVTDPPYGLKYCGKEWDKAMPSVAIWKECLRVLKPGAWAFVMCDSRQDLKCRMILNLESAGFKIDYTGITWVHNNGYPKGGGIAKGIGKKTPNAAEKFNGAYGGFPLKPAKEEVLVVMKPREKGLTYVGQALSNSKAVIWRDDCLIPYAEGEERPTRDFTKQRSYASGGAIASEGTSWIGDEKGRVPANILVSDHALLHHSKYYDLDRWYGMNVSALPVEARKTFPCLVVPKPKNKEKNAGLDGIENEHETVKPGELMNHLITLGSRPGDIVCDPFCGSGTTLCEAKMLGRSFIGMEREEKYFKISRARIEALDMKKAA